MPRQSVGLSTGTLAYADIDRGLICNLSVRAWMGSRLVFAFNELFFFVLLSHTSIVEHEIYLHQLIFKDS